MSAQLRYRCNNLTPCLVHDFDLDCTDTAEFALFVIALYIDIALDLTTSTNTC